MRKGTGELLEILKKSPDLSKYMETAADNMAEPVSVADCFNEIIEEKGLEKGKVIHEAGLERKYGYELLRNSKKKPSRDKVLALCFATGLAGDETQEVLKKTKYPLLYPRHERDCVIFWGLDKHKSLSEVNDFLYEMNQPVIETAGDK